MTQLEIALFEIAAIADANGMRACLVGHQVQNLDSRESDLYLEAYMDDARLLRVSSKSAPTKALLEVELDSYLRLYKHRDCELTSRYKGRRITLEWIKSFVLANAAMAVEINARVASPLEFERIEVPWLSASASPSLHR